MKHAFFTGTSLLLLSFSSFSQASITNRFPANGSNVIAYKQGTSCTASPYAFYMINDPGTQASTPFYTITNTSREVNGIGINPVDFFLYGVEYDRDAACAFSNFHLKRYDTQGGNDDLGVLPTVGAGGSVTAALGCVTTDGRFIYSAKDAGGNSYACTINNIASLPANPGGTLALSSAKKITNNASTFSYADWAVHPTNGKIYTYGIANVGGVSTGKVLELDPLTGVLQSVGSSDAGSFLDPARDNFGGVYFGSDGLLYGVNVNTRKIYKINVSTGTTTYVTTVSGSGQIRADMGGYTTGWTLLPVAFTNINLSNKSGNAVLSWSIGSGDGMAEFVVERNTGDGFKDLQTVWAIEPTLLEYQAHVPAASKVQYRVKAVAVDGKIAYSSVVVCATNDKAMLTVLGNPVRDGMLRFVPGYSAAASYSITNSSGQIVKSGVVTCTKGAVATVNTTALQGGIYLLTMNNETTVRFMISAD